MYVSALPLSLFLYSSVSISVTIAIVTQISTLFLEHLFPLFKLYKKDIIKFAWNHIKADDSATRHWSYINICRFVSSFDSPPKIIIQV